MKNRIDLSNYQIRTDLIIENINPRLYNNNINIEVINNYLKVTTIYVSKELEKEFQKKEGNYITI